MLEPTKTSVKPESFLAKAGWPGGPLKPGFGLSGAFLSLVRKARERACPEPSRRWAAQVLSRAASLYLRIKEWREA